MHAVASLEKFVIEKTQCTATTAAKESQLNTAVNIREAQQAPEKAVTRYNCAPSQLSLAPRANKPLWLQIA